MLARRWYSIMFIFFRFIFMGVLKNIITAATLRDGQLWSVICWAWIEFSSILFIFICNLFLARFLLLRECVALVLMRLLEFSQIAVNVIVMRRSRL